MMIEELSPAKTSVFDQKAGLSYQFDRKTALKLNNHTDSKRYVTYRWCSRLAASKLQGGDLAVEYFFANSSRIFP